MSITRGIRAGTPRGPGNPYLGRGVLGCAFPGARAQRVTGNKKTSPPQLSGKDTNTVRVRAQPGSWGFSAGPQDLPACCRDPTPPWKSSQIFWPCQPGSQASCLCCGPSEVQGRQFPWLTPGCPSPRATSQPGSQDSRGRTVWPGRKEALGRDHGLQGNCEWPAWPPWPSSEEKSFTSVLWGASLGTDVCHFCSLWGTGPSSLPSLLSCSQGWVPAWDDARGHMQRGEDALVPWPTGLLSSPRLSAAQVHTLSHLPSAPGLWGSSSFSWPQMWGLL